MSAGLHRQFAIEEIQSLGYFQSVDWIPSIDSTNKRLAQLVREDSISLPALLATDQQTSGVGRGSNQWWSPTGCLMFSMAIPIGISETELCVSSDLLPLRTGCVVAECLEGFSVSKPLVKWPNDVYIAGKKVCGILIEVIPKSNDRTAVAIIGVGINCRVELRDAPTEILANATSLHVHTKKELESRVSTESILVAFIHQWLEIQQRQQEDPKWLLKSWPKRSLLDGQWIEAKHSSGLARGRCLGINESGAILIQNEQLEIVEVLAGTILSFGTA